MYGYNSLSSVTNPIRRRISTAWSASRMGLPNTCAVPLSQRNNPIRLLMVVVLPAPFRPKKPKMLPASCRNPQVQTTQRRLAMERLTEPVGFDDEIGHYF